MSPISPTRAFLAAMLLGVGTLPVLLHAQAGGSATQVLLDKAHALETRGRLDMASQAWQQVLLSEPNNVEALAGLARSAKVSGNSALAGTYLDRLRAINPKDSNIARIQATDSQASQTAQLQQAGKYAQSGQYSQAMTIYRKEFGENPPAGDWALAYYETEAAIPEDRAHAITGLRGMVKRYPDDSRYQVALGRILTYNPQTRSEGRRFLEKYPNDVQAVEALHQSLVWDQSNPASAADLRAYLSKHDDPQLAEALKRQPKGGPAALPQTPQQIAQTKMARARNQEEAAAYSALNARHLEEAGTRFKEILAKEPQNPRALAGLGYVRMQQGNFGGAISFLEQAKQYGARDSGLDEALESSHFYSVMGEGQMALADNDLTTAEQKYQQALSLRPNSPEALEGLGGTLLKAQQNDAAAQVYERFTKAQPASIAAWRGLFLAQSNGGNAPGALITESKIPSAVRLQLMKDMDYLRSLASDYSAVGRDADAQRVLQSALQLPYPSGGNGLKIETQLQYGALLQQANRPEQAAALYNQALRSDLSNAQAWQGLIRAQHGMKQDAAALQSLQNMPPAVYQEAMRDPGFQTTVASIYQAQNRIDIAQEILEKSIAAQMKAGQKPSTAVLLQLAGMYMARNDAQHAFPIYRKILTADPQRTDAWKGLITVLHGTGRDQDALAQIQQIPQTTRTQLESDPEYLQAVAGVYNGLGQPQQAMIYMQRVQQHYAAQHAAPPADIDIQDAWLLYNGGNDAGLYRQLMLLGGRPDLTDEQRRTVQTIWSNWAVRRASQTAATGNTKRSLAILNAAAKAFPDNPGVVRALATGYARAGQPKQAIAIFHAQDMTAASSTDYKSAVGAALAAGDKKDAEIWLRYGLDQYPRDAEMLNLAARFEQARGNNGRAADYFKASLAAMPPGDPGAELANELSQPAPVRGLPSAGHAADLSDLLGVPEDGDTDGSPREPAKPYLPSYSNYYGQAPVQVNTPYSGHSSVVPQYMSNPAARHPRSAEGMPGEYVPSTSASALPPVSPSGVSQPPAEDIVAYGAPTAANDRERDQALSYATPSASGAGRSQDVYGPYVPYVPSANAAQSALAAPAEALNNPAWGYTPSPTAVRLGDATPHGMPQQKDVTDVLPTTRYVPNAHVGASRSGRPMVGQSSPPQDDLVTHNAQYAPGAQAGNQNGDSYGQQYPQPGLAPRRSTPRRKLPAQPAAPAIPAAAPAPTQESLGYPSVARPLTDSGYPTLTPMPSQDQPPTDSQLMARQVPPLRGSYGDSGVVPGGQMSPREKTEMELAAIESSYSGWVGGAAIGRYRSGNAGFDRLNDTEAPLEASVVMGKSVRVSVIPRAIFLSSGVIDVAQFQSQSGGTIPVLGTLPGNALIAPAEQFSSGVGGELQLVSQNIGLSIGYTPYDFLVSNVIGHFRLRPLGGPISFYGDRDSVKDTQLSYAGLRDPGTISALYSGNIWGGVVSTGGGIRFEKGDERAGLYAQGGGAVIDGHHVLENRRYDGTLGAYFLAHRWPEYGKLNIGVNLFGMHYDYNEQGMSYGNGGYFSPNAYFLASVPFTFEGKYGKNFNYTVNGSAGIQTFQESSAPYYPLDLPLQTASNNAYYSQSSDTGLNYGVDAQGAYRFGDRWYVGGFLTANNTRNYNLVTGGFYVRFMFKPQVGTEGGPRGLFPINTGFRPLRVP
ncbi:MAG: cellulose synthase subunit BcsC-related outer membrane protein [Edaphobacter sp.]|uniref:cellulose synthase subunit BcsC-related outer membrane protein n=1 Tax=Edaphobacter sp. TaxID=1934404 RepID=UPI0023932CFE|nr:cellulose synthase subunit BcsC-related outer membrane protein [Edaphobacter sp.]MDE1178439.1 cellulose synthase subunit BcsC-related outer membrane protein [Edaphobacter sp.]